MTVWLSEDPYLAMGDGLAEEDGPETAGPPDWLTHAPVESRGDFERAQHRCDEAEAGGDDRAGDPAPGARHLDVHLGEAPATTDLDRLPVRHGHREV